MKYILLLATLLLTACNISISGTLYPVEGKLAKQVPLPVVKMTVHNVERNSGEVELTLPSGEHCRGHWSVTAPRMVGTAVHSGSGSISRGLDTAFVNVHGTSYIDAAQPGVNKGQAMLSGAAGTVIECAFLVGSGTASGYGVAKDNRGNVFKVIF